jgi:nucleotide-binding universal stress UspA family protein
VLIWLCADVRAQARPVIMLADHGNSPATMTAKPLVTATDGSEESLRAVEWAAREAVVRGVPLRIVSAVQIPGIIGLQVRVDRDFVADLIHQERDQAFAAAAARAAEVAPCLQVDTVPLSGRPAQAVTESGSGALMLVLGSRGVGAFGWLAVGSVSRYAAAHASCPVVVVRGETAAVHRQVGIGIGDLDTCADSLTFAFEEASLRKASLMAIHALYLPAPSRAWDLAAIEADAAGQLAGLLDTWRTTYPDVPVSQDAVKGHPGRALVGLSARADLVVIARHAEHPVPGPGSVRHALLNHALGPVAVVPSS